MLFPQQMVLLQPTWGMKKRKSFPSKVPGSPAEENRGVKCPSALSGWWHFKPGLKALASKFKWVWPFFRKFHRFLTFSKRGLLTERFKTFLWATGEEKPAPPCPPLWVFLTRKSLAKFTVALRGDYSYSSSSYHSEIESIHIHMGSIYSRSLRLLISARENC